MILGVEDLRTIQHVAAATREAFEQERISDADVQVAASLCGSTLRLPSIEDSSRLPFPVDCCRHAAFILKQSCDKEGVGVEASLQTKVIVGGYNGNTNTADPNAARKHHVFFGVGRSEAFAGLCALSKSIVMGGEENLDTDFGEIIIADITADQFAGPPMYVGALADPWTVVHP